MSCRPLARSCAETAHARTRGLQNSGHLGAVLGTGTLKTEVQDKLETMGEAYGTTWSLLQRIPGRFATPAPGLFLFLNTHML